MQHGHMVDDLYELYKDYGSKMNYKDQVARDIMQELLAAVRQDLATAEAWLSQRHEGMKEELVKGSTQLGEAALNMLQEMASSALNDAECNPAVRVRLNISDLRLYKCMEGSAKR
jgi:hypothetical protein